MIFSTVKWEILSTGSGSTITNRISFWLELFSLVCYKKEIPIYSDNSCASVIYSVTVDSLARHCYKSFVNSFAATRCLTLRYGISTGRAFPDYIVLRNLVLKSLNIIAEISWCYCAEADPRCNYTSLSVGGGSRIILFLLLHT
jgi:hypothetical protein